VILLVEDAVVCGFLRTALTRMGHQAFWASPADGRRLLQENPAINLLITNAPQRFSEFGDVPVLYLAACPDPNAVGAFRRKVILRKPFTPVQLSEALRQLLP